MSVVELVTDLSHLHRLRDEWDALADRFDNPLLRHAWAAAAAETYGAGEELAVYIVRRGGRLAAVAPLILDRGGLPRLRTLGFQDKEPEGFLYRDEDALAELCRVLLRTRRPLLLPRLSTTSAEWRLLTGTAGGQGLAVARPGTNSCNATVLPRDVAEFEAALGAKRRGRFKRSRAALEEEGPVTFEMLSPDPDGVDAAIDELTRVEAGSWKLGNGSALACRPVAAAFLREHSRRAAGEGMLRFSRLRIGEATVACQLDLEHRGWLWCQKIGYDDRWAKHSPGILLMHEVLKWAASRGLSGLEHLGFAEDWQLRWPYEVRELGTLRFYPRRLIGAVALGTDTAAYAARKVRWRLEAASRGPKRAAA